MFFKSLVLAILTVSLSECTRVTSNACVGKPDGTLLPNPDDCRKFFNCNGGIAFVGDCPVNLYFNPKNSRCDYQSNVECQNPQDPDEEKVDCPPGGDLTFVASKVRCDWYYICIQGTPTRMPCADGMHFSETEGRCEPKETANCQIGMTSTTTLPSTTLKPSSTTASPTSTALPPSNEFDKYCQPNKLHSIPHPFNCNHFILCFNGTAIERYCAEELHYSAKHDTCLKPREAQCISDGTICPETNDVNDIVVVENIYDCSSFYICFNGSPVPIQCAHGQHWSQEKGTCVLEENSNCQAIDYPFPDLNIRHATCHATGSYLVPQLRDETMFLLCDNGTPSILDYSVPIDH